MLIFEGNIMGDLFFAVTLPLSKFLNRSHRSIHLFKKKLKMKLKNFRNDFLDKFKCWLFILYMILL